MTVNSTDRKFQDWQRVSDNWGRQGVIIWDPDERAYKVLWDDNGWEEYSPADTRGKIHEL